MVIFESRTPLIWGELDLPLLGVTRDWRGDAVDPPASFCVAEDGERLWFLAGHRRPASLHPQARPGKFQAELWRHDVAELFLADPASGRYLELNLAPNGAWWSCEFTAPRLRAEAVDVAIPEVATFSDLAPDGSWLAALAVPLDLLRARLGYGEKTTANVAFILESPAQRFFSVADLGPGEPDFHRPNAFPTARRMAVPDL